MTWEDTASPYKPEHRFHDLFSDHGEDIDLVLDIASVCENPVLELLGGTLRVSIPLARRGYIVHSIEPHPRMIESARNNLAGERFEVRNRISLLKEDVRDFKHRRRYGFIYFTYNSFLRLLNGFDQVLTMRTLRDHLKRSGKLLIDVFKPDREQQESLGYGGSMDVMESAGDTVVKHLSHRYDPETRRVHLIYSYDVLSQGEHRRIDVPFELRYMEHHDFLELFERTGFRLLEVYGDYHKGPMRIDSPRMIYLLELAEWGD